MSRYWERSARTDTIFWQVFAGIAISMCACAALIRLFDILPRFGLLIVVVSHLILIGGWFWQGPRIIWWRLTLKR